MRKRDIFTGFLILLIGLFAYYYNNIKRRQREFNIWDYNRIYLWGEVSPICTNGKSQSPINIIPSQAVIQSNSLLTIDYDLIEIESIENLDHQIRVNTATNYFTTYQDKQYQLIQFHFHADSEHTINGIYQPLELHLVHQDSSSNILVIGILFKEGENNLSFQQFLDTAPKEFYQTNNINTTFALSPLLPADRSFYSYNGSLTTPNCNEGVQWIVMKDTVQISSNQILEFLEFRNHVKNNRNIQETGARTINYHPNK